MAGSVIETAACPGRPPVILPFLGVNIVAALWCVVTGALAASAGKRRGRHPRAGRLYLGGLVVLLGH